MRGRLIGALLSVAFAGGCIDDLPDPQLILDTRPVGARMEVEGEPERAWPRPDESGTVTIHVVDPTESEPVGWAFLVCPAFITPSGLTFCGADPLSIAIQMEPSLDAPTIPVSFPSDRLEGFDNVLVQGVICPGGSPEVDLMADPPEVGCEGGEAARQLLRYTIQIARDGVTPNQNPTVPDDAFTWAGQPWPASTTVPPETDCSAVAGTPELPLASRETPGGTGTVMGEEDAPQELVTITGDQTDREEYPSGDGTARESLVFAHYASAGDPLRVFSVIDDVELTAELKWTYPDAEEDPEIPAGGMLVRWWFTVIDQRGGTSELARRFVCVTN
jgi:hypothetical protein